MLTGLNLGMEEPLGRELLAAVRDLTVQVDRFNLPRAEFGRDCVRACVANWVDTSIRPQLMFHRVEQADPTYVREIVAQAMDLYHDDGFDLEGPNEYRIAGVSRTDAIEATKTIHRVARDMGWHGAMLSCSIMNLDPTRDIPDLRVFAKEFAAEIILSAHRYAKGTWQHAQPWEQPWIGRDRDDECQQLLEEAGGHQVAITEFGPHRAPVKVMLGLRTEQFTFADCQRDIVRDLQLFDRHGFERACLYTWNDGPDPNDSEHQRGICDASGQPSGLHPHAVALRDWRV